MEKLHSVWVLGIVTAASAFAQRVVPPQAEARIAREVRHEILLLPSYGVFDFIGYHVDGYNVTLVGQVTQPILRTNAERAIGNIEGVEKVDDEIEVLPPSALDNALRTAVYRAIYLQPALQRYAYFSVAPIRIIVNLGRVTLEGVVANQTDKALAVMSASTVAGVVGQVTDHLAVEAQP